MKIKSILPLLLGVCVLTLGAYAQQDTKNIAQNNSQTFNCDSCNAHTILSDDFEQYPAGSFPSGNWSYTGNADIVIDNTISAAGAQSLVMNGTIAGCWEAISCLPIPAPLSTTTGFLADYFFYAGSNHSAGCHPHTFYCSLASTNNWSTWASATLLSSDYNGNIFDRAGNSISNYTFDTWYNVKIRYDRISVDSVNLHYWINGVCATTETVAADANENSFAYLCFGSGDGSTWIDSLRLLQCDTASLPFSLFTAQHILCPGTCTNFNNLSTNASTYLWSFPGGSPSTSTDANPLNVCYNTPGHYPVSLIATNTFGSDTLTLNNYITVHPYPSPQGIAQSGDTLFANAGAVSYQWYYEGNIIPGATDYFYVANQSGDFGVVATDANNCGVEAVINDVVAGIESINNKVENILFPNPFTNAIHVKVIDNNQSQIIIYDMLSRKLLQKSFTESTTLNTEQLAKGIYIYEVRNKNGVVQMGTVVKE